MQQFLKPAHGAARARIVPAELLDQFLVAADDAVATLHVCFGGISLPALTRDLETGTARRVSSFSWHGSSSRGSGRAFFTTTSQQSTRFLLTTQKQRNRIRAHLHMNTHTQPLFEDADRETTIA
jgi:hypothetical protein